MFKQRLKELRNQRGYTQVGLSRALGVSQQAVGKWETGRCTPDPQMLTRLAATLDTTVDYLLGGGNVLAECMVPVLGTVKAGFGALAFETAWSPASTTATWRWCAGSLLWKAASWG